MDAPQRRTVVVTVATQEQYDDGPFCFGASYEPGSLDAVIESLQAVKASVPPEYRAAATCEIRSVGGYEDSHYAMITVEYSGVSVFHKPGPRARRGRLI